MPALSLIKTILFASGILAVALHVAPAVATAEGASDMMCKSFENPVVRLSYGSRYQKADKSRSAVDKVSNAEVNAALKPVDDFIRELASVSERLDRRPDDSAQLAQCALTAIDDWATADALSDLASFTANLSVGARIAGIALNYEQILPYAPGFNDRAALEARIESWLTKRSLQQIDFWEKDATSGARSGNLRAWAALAILSVGQITQQDNLSFWALGSYTRILCTAREDGSLPQETKRGKYALHYQFHAILPLTLIAARLESQMPYVKSLCDNALPKAVAFALGDFKNGGVASQQYSGKPQSYFDGTSKFGEHSLSWVPAYLCLFPEDVNVRDRAADYDRFYHSKLGGAQARIWAKRSNASSACRGPVPATVDILK